MKTALSIAVLTALHAAPVPAQTSIPKETVVSLAEIMHEAITLRGKYGEIIGDIDTKRITPQYAAPDIVRLARRLNVLNNREQYILRQLSREQRRDFKQSIRNHARINQSLQRARNSMDGLRDRLERLNYYDSIKLMEACKYFDNISKKSYLGL